jgi:hypothetical protein
MVLLQAEIRPARRQTPISVTVSVPVMQIRIMRVLVPHGFVLVPVGVRFGHWPIMVMLMVVIMHMGMVVLQSMVVVLMFMTLRKVQP